MIFPQQINDALIALLRYKKIAFRDKAIFANLFFGTDFDFYLLNIKI